MGDTVKSSGSLITLTNNGVETLSTEMMLAGLGAQMTSIQETITSLNSRVSTLEGRPEEVAHFTATARLPNVAALSTFTVTLTGLVPAKKGDVLKEGETVTVNVGGKLPNGVTMVAPATVSADGTVVLSFAASIALSSTTALVWSITALR